MGEGWRNEFAIIRETSPISFHSTCGTVPQALGPGATAAWGEHRDHCCVWTAQASSGRRQTCKVASATGPRKRHRSMPKELWKVGAGSGRRNKATKGKLLQGVFFFNLYSFERHSDRKGNDKKSPRCWFTPQMGQGDARGWVLQLVSHGDHHPLPSQVLQQGAGLWQSSRDWNRCPHKGCHHCRWWLKPLHSNAAPSDDLMKSTNMATCGKPDCQ